MRNAIVVLLMLFFSIVPAAAQVSFSIGVPGASIGLNLPVYPQLVPVPGYPVYYAPQVNSNYFFYDGLYWVYQGDNWYASSWYNGPWGLVTPAAVPLFVLRVPVRYYRQPPVYFRGWRGDAPPRWDEHWGNSWSQQRSGWNNWNRSAAPAPAPLPAYQRQYSGTRYPRPEQQQALQSQNYRYQPQDAAVQSHQTQRIQSVPPPAPQARAVPQQERNVPQQQGTRGTYAPPVVQQAAPPVARAPQQKPVAQVQAPVNAVQGAPQQGGVQQKPQRHPPPQAAPQQAQQPPRPQGTANGSQGKGPPAEPRQNQDKKPQGNDHAQEPGQGQAKGHDKNDPQGGERNKP